MIYSGATILKRKLIDAALKSDLNPAVVPLLYPIVPLDNNKFTSNNYKINPIKYHKSIIDENKIYIKKING